MGQIAIYALCEFSDLKNVRYVGRSADPRKRLAAHVYRRHLAPKSQWGLRNTQEWICSVLDRGGSISCVVIEWVTADDAVVAERFWITRLICEGHNLTNYAGTLFFVGNPPIGPKVAKAEISAK